MTEKEIKLLIEFVKISSEAELKGDTENPVLKLRLELEQEINANNAK